MVRERLTAASTSPFTLEAKRRRDSGVKHGDVYGTAPGKAIKITH
jgi:hypothetical protein